MKKTKMRPDLTAPLTREDKLKLIYRHTHRDFKSVIGGVGAILVLRPGGTTLVGMTSLTEAEIADKLPYAIKKEAERRLLVLAKGATPDEKAMRMEEAAANGFHTIEDAHKHNLWLWNTAGDTFKNWVRSFSPEKADLYALATA